jgi:putative flippase GtrA
VTGIRWLAHSPFGRLFAASRPFRFLVVGGFNTALCYLVFAGLFRAGLTIWAANFGALCFGIVLSFLTQGRIVFGNHDPRRFLRFVATWLVIYVVQTGVIGLMAKAGIKPLLAGLIVLPGTAILSYLVQKMIVFRPSPESKSA